MFHYSSAFMLLNVQDLCYCLGKKLLTIDKVFLSVSRFRPELVSGRFRAQRWRRTPFSSSRTLPALPPSLPPARQRSPSLCLLVSSLLLASTAASQLPPSPSFQKNLRHTRESRLYSDCLHSSSYILYIVAQTTKSSCFEE